MFFFYSSFFLLEVSEVSANDLGDRARHRRWKSNQKIQLGKLTLEYCLKASYFSVLSHRVIVVESFQHSPYDGSYLQQLHSVTTKIGTTIPGTMPNTGIQGQIQ